MLNFTSRYNQLSAYLKICVLGLASCWERKGYLSSKDTKALGIGLAHSEKQVETVLFVCKGNICRSAYAEKKLKLELEAKGFSGIQVNSGGVWTKDGKPANEQAILSAKERGVDLSEHLTSVVTTDDLELADLILIMDISHRNAIRELQPQALQKTFYLGRLSVGKKDPLIIKDPYGRSAEVFQKCFDVIDRSLTGLINLLQKNG
jgi:protein-tyrosine phosphatase